MKDGERHDEMAAQLELMLRQEEERVLVKASAKLSSQLNRLKVEELALMSLIRSANIRVDQQSQSARAIADNLDTDVTYPADTASPAVASSSRMFQTSEELNKTALCLDIKSEEDKNSRKRKASELAEEEEEEDSDDNTI